VIEKSDMLIPLNQLAMNEKLVAPVIPGAKEVVTELLPIPSNWTVPVPVALNLALV